MRQSYDAFVPGGIFVGLILKCKATVGGSESRPTELRGVEGRDYFLLLGRWDCAGQK